MDTSTVLGKVVTVLHAFTADDHGVSLAELGRRTGLAKGTLHRVVNDLLNVRLLDKDASGYRLGGQMFELGMRASVERRLLEVAIPFMEDLYERTHETVHLGVPEGTEVVYVSKIGGHRPAPAPSRVGGRMPMYCTAIGKALLAYSGPDLFADVVADGLARKTPRTITAPGRFRAHIDRIAEMGVAFEHEESAVGLVCVAAPVLVGDEEPVDEISVTGTETRYRREQRAAAVQPAAAGVAATLARRAALRTP